MFSHSKRLLSLLALLVLLFVIALPAAAQMTPSVTVSDQAILKGTVTIEKVVSNGPGWIVIHTQKDGKPGPIIGYAAVNDGENDNVVVQIDATAATATLYAMLHTDAGQVGMYEFPGDDVPVKVGDKVVTPPFRVTVGVGVADQPISGGTVTVARVFSDGPGWIVIHTQKDGKPGPIIGHAAVSDGENDDVVVQVDASAATDTLYAMLHTDAGQAGTYEFPGDDTPVKVGDVIITPPFKVVGNAPATLPETGAAPSGVSLSLLLLVVGALALGGGFGLMQVRKGR